MAIIFFTRIKKAKPKNEKDAFIGQALPVCVVLRGSKDDHPQ